MSDVIPNKPITKKYNPCSVEEIEKETTKNTICDELRKAHRCIEINNFWHAKVSIRIAITMAKAMAAKLKDYNARFAKEMFMEKDEDDGG